MSTERNAEARGDVRGSLEKAVPHNGSVHEHLAAIVESSDDAIISKDLKGTIQSWNGGAERIFGYKAEEAVGRNISMLACPERLEEIEAIMARVARGQRVDHYQTKCRTKDGRNLSVSLTVSPIRDSAGNIVGASKIARDITEQLRYQQALEQFAYSASHDLREPLRMVSTYSEMMMKKYSGQLGERGDEYIGHIVSGVLRMEQILKDLQAFAQASTTEDDLKRESDAGAALGRALAGLKGAIEGSGATVTHEPLPRVPVHEFLLEQLFQNLIGNAIRYRGDEPLRIHVAAQRCGDTWTFSVRDNGIGIDPQYQEKIFGMFKRLHNSSTYPGTGMGLAICRRIVERAGGRIWVESELGRGATFLFTIPAGHER